MCVSVDYLYLLLRPAVDLCSVSYASFDNDPPVYSSWGKCECPDVTVASAACLH